MGLKLNDHASWAGTEAAGLPEKLQAFTFKEFVQKYKRDYKEGSSTWEDREKIFNTQLAKIVEKARTADNWKPGINHFLDWTDQERKQVLGYKPSKKGPGTDFARSNPPGNHSHNLDMSKELPESIDWTEPSTGGLQFTGKSIRDQGSCGSCWAVSTASIMEAHLEKAQSAKLLQMGKYNDFVSMALSSQSLVSCVPNPHKCGGTGGCDGATSPLAFEWIKSHGMPWGTDYQYTSFAGNSGTCDNSKAGVVTIGSYVNLPSNDGHALMQALAQHGPVVLSVAANPWFSYSEGIFEPETQDWDINHAVAGFGYGKEGEHLYWLVKNSWGQGWGEDGFIRLKRYPLNSNLVSTAACGMDTTPQDGDACEGETDPVKVCGNCGILYASSYPVNVHFK